MSLTKTRTARAEAPTTTDDDAAAAAESTAAKAPDRRSIGSIRAEVTSTAAGFWASLTWISRGLLASVGFGRILVISIETFLGSIAISLMSFSLVFIIRSASPSGDQMFTAIPLPDVPLGILISGLLLGGTVGAALFYRAEQHASTAAMQFGNSLRTSAMESLNRPQSRGWQSSFDDRPQQVIVQAVIAGVREISIAARDVLRLVGPVSMLSFTLLTLFALQPVLSLILIPLSAIVAAPTILTNRRMARLNASFEESQTVTTSQVQSGLEMLLEEGYDGGIDQTIQAAHAGDKATHDRMLEPVRLRAISTVVTAVFSSVVVAAFFVRGTDDAPVDFLELIVYLIVLRLCGTAAQKIVSSMMAVTRRSVAIARYRGLETQLAAFRRRRAVRADADELELPLIIEDADGYSLTIQRGHTAVILVAKRPTRATAYEVLQVMEKNLARQGILVDLIGTSRVSTASDFGQESHIAGTSTSDNTLHPIHLAIDVDLSAMAIQGGRGVNLVLTHIPAHTLQTSLDEWAHLLTGVIVVADREVTVTGDLDWARENRDEIFDGLNRVPPAKRPKPQQSQQPAE